MKKIIILGTTGSGKSTFAKKLSLQLGIPNIQLDLLFWKENWTYCDDPEFFSKIENATQGDTWIVDGNYSRTRHLTWPKADTIIWIDLPFWKTIYQNVSRSVKRAISQEELWPNTGNKESFSRMFSKESIILWLLKTYKKNRKRYLKAMELEEFSHINFIRLRSRKEIDSFLKGLSNE
ncbi:hypothetical protein OAT67_08815 [Bacteriovoracaceae bacterium]|nr:hypothetical protein [Bacteriovoracaceae bacterium]